MGQLNKCLIPHGGCLGHSGFCSGLGAEGMGALTLGLKVGSHGGYGLRGKNFGVKPTLQHGAVLTTNTSDKP